MFSLFLLIFVVLTNYIDMIIHFAAVEMYVYLCMHIYRFQTRSNPFTWSTVYSCNLVHKIINFRSWCALNFSSKRSIVYFCALNYRVQKKREYDFLTVIFIQSPTINYIHRVISWLNCTIPAFKLFLKLIKWYIIPSKIHAWSYLGPNCPYNG